MWQTWSGKTTRQYKQFKGLKKESLRDNMTNIELALNILAEASTTEISKAQNLKGFRSCLRKRKIDNETDRSRSSYYTEG